MPSLLGAMFPPAPKFTDTNLPSLAGKVYIITGAASGIGFELAKILYAAGGAVYVAARSTSRCEGAISKIKAEVGNGKAVGRLESMVVDLADLRTIKAPVEEFMQKEQRLDVLFHNAGVMTPPAGSKDALGHDLETAIHCLAPYLMTLLLEPILIRTAEASPEYGVRVVWVVSILQLGSPEPAMSFDRNGAPLVLKNVGENYMQSKIGGTWLAAEFSKRLGSRSILSVSAHPGLIKTDLQRNFPAVQKAIVGLIFKSAVYGAYTELYAGFSPDLKAKHNGGYLMAWGRVAERPDHIQKGLKGEKEGGSGAAETFVRYCDQETKPYL